MNTLTEKHHTGGCILNLDDDGHFSLDNALLAAGQNLQADTVLGLIAGSPAVYTQWNDGASDGSQTAVAILYESTDATAGNTACVVIARRAEVIATELIWPAGSPAPDVAEGIAELKAAGIIVRA